MIKRRLLGYTFNQMAGNQVLEREGGQKADVKNIYFKAVLVVAGRPTTPHHAAVSDQSSRASLYTTISAGSGTVRGG